MRMLALVLSLLLVASCAAAPSEPVDPASSGARERVVHIRSQLTVADRAGAIRSLRTLTEDAGGFIASSETMGEHRTVLHLRVPTGELAALRSELDGLDADRRETETTEDVTAAHTDLSARLRSARATESRLLTLLADRTSALTDVLAAERELERVRERIEQLDAEDRTVRERVALADVQLDLTDTSTSFTDEPGVAIAAAFQGGVEVTYAVCVAGAVLVSALLPAGSVVLGMLLALSFLWRRVRSLI